MTYNDNNKHTNNTCIHSNNENNDNDNNSNNIIIHTINDSTNTNTNDNNTNDKIMIHNDSANSART